MGVVKEELVFLNLEKNHKKIIITVLLTICKFLLGTNRELVLWIIFTERANSIGLVVFCRCIWNAFNIYEKVWNSVKIFMNLCCFTSLTIMVKL
ncbi:hypothetical protein CW304_24675 [Bacillus sp. UFRGS-B20]|nr:hypothetical protein CW304_24675 [Bacillus sp. UFRGS-B20]